jgi:hypothetical protein
MATSVGITLTLVTTATPAKVAKLGKLVFVKYVALKQTRTIRFTIEFSIQDST